MAATTEDITTINDLADAYLVLDPTCERSDHLGVLQIAAAKLGIPADLNAPLTAAQADALDQWWTESGR